MKVFKYVFILMGLMFFSACSQTVRVSALKPAQVDEITHYKKIAIGTFGHDHVGLSNKIESQLSHATIDKEPFFTIIGRKDTNKIFQEQRLQLSGLLDAKSVVKVGHLLGAQAMINGDVSDASVYDSRYYVERIHCKDKKCKDYYTYNVSCTKRTASLSAELRITSVQEGDVIFADTLQETRSWYHCADRSSALPSTQSALNLLATIMSKKFSNKLSPYYKHYAVPLLDDSEIDYSDEEEELLEKALVYIDHQRYDKAERLLEKLMLKTSGRCYVATYDLGVLKEKAGLLEDAQQLYKMADSLAKEPNETIDLAIFRVQDSIRSKKLALKQLKQ